MSALRSETSFMDSGSLGGQHHAQIREITAHTLFDHGAPRQGNAFALQSLQIANLVMLLAGDDDVRVGKNRRSKNQPGIAGGRLVEKTHDLAALALDAARLAIRN